MVFDVRNYDLSAQDSEELVDSIGVERWVRLLTSYWTQPSAEPESVVLKCIRAHNGSVSVFANILQIHVSLLFCIQLVISIIIQVKIRFGI